MNHYVTMLQVAILRYVGAGDEDPPGDITYIDADRPGKVIGPSERILM